jgi:hypothetical protein
MKKNARLVLVVAGCMWLSAWTSSAQPGPQGRPFPPAPDRPREQPERDDNDPVQRAKDLVATQSSFSSQQVKRMAQRLPDDTARLEFATAAYPKTVDPENFYEVYDAFQTFSKVMRLHDRIRLSSAAAPQPQPVPVPAPAIVSDSDLRDILGALRRESFDNTRLQAGRQILRSTPQKFLSAQVRQLVRCFDFENNKLEFAKFAFDYVADPEKYFLVNEAFDFENSKQALSQYLQSHGGPPRGQPQPPPKR